MIENLYNNKKNFSNHDTFFLSRERDTNNFIFSFPIFLVKVLESC